MRQRLFRQIFNNEKLPLRLARKRLFRKKDRNSASDGWLAMLRKIFPLFASSLHARRLLDSMDLRSNEPRERFEEGSFCCLRSHRYIARRSNGLGEHSRPNSIRRGESRSEMALTIEESALILLEIGICPCCCAHQWRSYSGVGERRRIGMLSERSWEVFLQENGEVIQ